MRNTELSKIINHVNAKIHLTKEEEDHFVSVLKERTFLKGQYIVQQDDIYRYQSFILNGKVRTFYLDDKGSEHIVAFGIENWWVGDICSFATQSPAEFNTECLEKTKVLQISHQDMEQLFEDIPKLERYFRLIIQAAYGNMSKRIVRNHSMPARDRYLLFLETYPEMAQRFPQYMIASYLGITKEFLSLIRNQISKEEKS